MKTMAFAAPDRTRHSVVSDERAKELLKDDERWSLVAEHGPADNDVPAENEPEAESGEGQPEQEE